METNKIQLLLLTIKERLANQLGLDVEDIHDNDDLTLDLHMKPSDLTDFYESLAQDGIDIQSLDLPSVKTVTDLVESLSSQEYV